MLFLFTFFFLQSIKLSIQYFTYIAIYRGVFVSFCLPNKLLDGVVSVYVFSPHLLSKANSIGDSDFMALFVEMSIWWEIFRRG